MAAVFTIYQAPVGSLDLFRKPRLDRSKPNAYWRFTLGEQKSLQVESFQDFFAPLEATLRKKYYGKY